MPLFFQNSLVLPNVRNRSSPSISNNNCYTFWTFRHERENIRINYILRVILLLSYGYNISSVLFSAYYLCTKLTLLNSRGFSICRKNDVAKQIENDWKKWNLDWVYPPPPKNAQSFKDCKLLITHLLNLVTSIALSYGGLSGRTLYIYINLLSNWSLT